MDFDLNEEQRLLKGSVDGIIEDAYGDFEKRKAYQAGPGGWSAELWATYAELGLLGLPFAEADGGLLEEIAAPDPDGRKLLQDAAERMRLSARGYHRVLRVARTLADLDARDTVRRLHIAEAVSYRRVILAAG